MNDFDDIQSDELDSRDYYDAADYDGQPTEYPNMDFYEFLNLLASEFCSLTFCQVTQPRLPFCHAAFGGTKKTFFFFSQGT